MLHGTGEVVLPGNGVIVDDPGVTGILRKSRRLAQKSCVPAAATDALHSSSDVIMILTIRKTGFSAPRT